MAGVAGGRGGVVMRANSAATTVFGGALSGDAPLLSTIWPPENGTTAVDFLTRWDHAPVPMMNLKFRVPNGPTATCSVSICTFAKDGRKWFVFQLLPLTMPPAPATATPQNAAAAPGTPAVENKVEQDAAPGAQAETGLRAATGADGLAGFQQRADEHSRPHVAAAGQGGAGASVAAFA